MLAAALLAGGAWSQEQPAAGAETAPQQEAPTAEAAAAAPDTQAAPAPPDNGVPQEAAPPPPEETTEERLERVQGELERARAALPPDAPPSPRVDLLAQLVGALERRVSLEGRMEEMEKLLADQERLRAEFEEKGIESEPPYPLRQLDALRDEVQRAERELETNLVSQKTFEAALRRAEEARRAVEQARRKAREDLDALRDESRRAAMTATLTEAQVRQRVAAEEEALARGQLELGKLERQLSEARLALVRDRRDFVEVRTEFSPEELQERIAEIEARGTQLAQQVQSLKRTHAENEKALSAAREAASAAQGEAEIRTQADRLARWDATAEATRKGIEYAEQQIAYLADERKLWENRHALRFVNNADQLLAWDEEVRRLLQDIAERRKIVEARLEDIRTTRLDLDMRLAAWEDAQGSKEEMQSRLNALGRRQDHGSNYLASLISLERLASRFQDEIRAKQSSRGWARQWATIKAEAVHWWNHELIVIDDSDLTPGKLVRAGVVFFLIVAAASLLKRLLLSRFIRHLEFGSQVTRTFTRDFISAVRRETKTLFLLLLAVYFALQSIPLGETLDSFVSHTVYVVVVLQLGIWINTALTLFVERARRRREALDPSSVSAFGFMLFAGRMLIWLVAFLLLMRHFGQNITGLMAGFGIGGIAIAFALQNILGDVFCSIAILLDRPFVVGDFIVVGDQKGVVEHIGIKTTRIRSLAGEQIILSNADLLGSRIQNYKRMQERRIVFGIGVVYQTPKEKLERIPGMLREIIEAQENVRFDRAHFKGFGAFSLDFEAVYFVIGSDYALYMDIQQKINFAIFSQFEQEGIVFAYPTQELFVNMVGTTPAPHPQPEG